MTVHTIAAPYDMGQRGVGVGLGPLRLAPYLNGSTIDVGEATSYEVVNRELQRRVRHCLAQREFPLVIAGNCNSALGTVAGIEPPVSIVWFDAHGDFNDESSTVSGRLEGMSLAKIAERCVPEERIVLAGFRDLDPGERVRLDASRVMQVPSGRFEDVNLPAGRVYLHIDMDVLDPAISPGVNFQAPGGLSEDELAAALAEVFGRSEVCAAAITNFNPAHDRESKTAHIIGRLIRNIEAR